SALGGEVDERLAADFAGRAQQLAAGEGPRRLAWIIASDRFGAVFPYGEPLAGDREFAGLRPDAAPADLPVAQMEGEGALGRHRVAVALEGSRKDHVAGGQRLRR